MRHFTANDFNWDKNKLYRFDALLATIEPHPEYEKMFYIRWGNGELSKDFYNLTRAKQNAVKWFIQEFNRMENTSTLDIPGIAHK